MKSPWDTKHVSSDTLQRSVRCRCRRGHPFCADIFTTINLETDKIALENLDETGMQNCRCAVCGIATKVAEPLILHNPSRREVVLVIPEVLSHQELDMRSELLEAISGSSPRGLPAYFADFQPMVGTVKLPEWLRGKGAAPAASESVSSTNTPPKHRRPLPNQQEDTLHRRPEIHEAFADLAADDHQANSITLNPGETEQNGLDGWRNGANFTSPGYSRSIQDAFRASLDSPSHPTSLDDKDSARSTGRGRKLRPQNARSYEPIHSVPIAAKEALFDIEGDSVVLIHRMPSDNIESFHPKRAELWFQLHEVSDYPLVVMTLVADPWRLDSPYLYWIVDVSRESHREVAYKLQKEFRAEIRLYTPALTEAERFSTESPRENNVAMVMERAVQLLAERPPISHDEAVVRLTRREDGLLGDRIPPFRYYDISTVADFDVTYSRLERLAHWLVPERYEYLVYIRSFPLKRLEAKINENLKAAIDLGVRIPDILRTRALDLELASDNADLLLKLSKAFERLLASGKGPSREVATQNWQYLQEDFVSAGLKTDFEQWVRADALLKEYRLSDQKEPNANP